MARCWYKNSKERPSFKELADELDGALTIIVGYVELNMELQNAITEKELGKLVNTIIVSSEMELDAVL